MTFQSFEVVSIASIDSLSRQPRLFDAAMMVARVMLGHDYEPGMGLGKNTSGTAHELWASSSFAGKSLE